MHVEECHAPAIGSVQLCSTRSKGSRRVVERDACRANSKQSDDFLALDAPLIISARCGFPSPTFRAVFDEHMHSRPASHQMTTSASASETENEV
jgi:hypothetical protein